MAMPFIVRQVTTTLHVANSKVSSQSSIISSIRHVCSHTLPWNRFPGHYTLCFSPTSLAAAFQFPLLVPPYLPNHFNRVTQSCIWMFSFLWPITTLLISFHLMSLYIYADLPSNVKLQSQSSPYTLDLCIQLPTHYFQPGYLKGVSS